MIDPFAALLNVGESVINRIWPDATERDKQMVRLQEIAQKGDIAQLEAEVKILTGQMEINATDAKHKSVFVAGWRPFCGWTGGLALAYAAILEPLMRFIASMAGYMGEFPVLDTTITMQILMGMLGIGAMRSFDKRNGTETNRI